MFRKSSSNTVVPSVKVNGIIPLLCVSYGWQLRLGSARCDAMKPDLARTFLDQAERGGLGDLPKTFKGGSLSPPRCQSRLGCKARSW